jgi:hypothetical protein
MARRRKKRKSSFRQSSMSNCRPSNLLGEVILPVVHATDIHLSESALATLMKPSMTMRLCGNDVGASGVVRSIAGEVRARRVS